MSENHNDGASGNIAFSLNIISRKEKPLTIKFEYTQEKEVDT